MANTNAFKSFKCESKLIGSIAAVNWSLENTTIVLLLKYQSNFGWSLEIPLINC